MKTDPPTSEPTSSSLVGGPQPPRPRGKVFDVMRPGKAPASPTSRPYIAGHKSSAQATQVRVSGIGASSGDGLLDAHKKVEIKPAQDGDMSPSGPAAETSGQPADAAAPFTAFTVSKGPTVPQTPADTPAPAIAAEAPSEPPAKAKKGKAAFEEGPEKPIDPAALDDAALDPEPPEPAASAPENEVPPLPIEEVQDPIHEAAAPSLEGQVVVSHHTTAPAGTGKLVGLIILMVLFAYIVLDILLDAGVLNSSIIPHTNLF